MQSLRKLTAVMLSLVMLGETWQVRAEEGEPETGEPEEETVLLTEEPEEVPEEDEPESVLYAEPDPELIEKETIYLPSDPYEEGFIYQVQLNTDGAETDTESWNISSSDESIARAELSYDGVFDAHNLNITVGGKEGDAVLSVISGDTVLDTLTVSAEKWVKTGPQTLYFDNPDITEPKSLTYELCGLFSDYYGEDQLSVRAIDVLAANEQVAIIDDWNLEGTSLNVDWIPQFYSGTTDTYLDVLDPNKDADSHSYIRVPLYTTITVGELLELIGIEADDTYVSIPKGETAEIGFITDPDDYPVDQIEIGSEDTGVCSVEWSHEGHTFFITGIEEGLTEVIIKGPGEDDAEETITVEVEEAVDYNIPTDLYYPVSPQEYDVRLPFDISEDDTWEITSDDERVSPYDETDYDGCWYLDINIDTPQDHILTTVINGKEHKTTVHIGNYVSMNYAELVFEGLDADPVNYTVKTSGKYTGNAWEMTCEADEGIVAAEIAEGEETAETVFEIAPLAEGTGQLYVALTDPNWDEDDDESFTLEAAAVTVLHRMTWEDLQTMIDQADNGQTIALDRDLSAQPGDKPLSIPEGKKITINLNRHTLNAARTEAAEEGWVITAEGELTLTGYGNITGGWTSGSCGGVKVSGTLILNGASITGNIAEPADGHPAEGAGVYVEGGTFIMNSGSISDNQADAENTSEETGCGGGVYVESGFFDMNGGTITGNTAKTMGGGVYCSEDGTITLSGHPVIQNNTGAGLSDNLYLPKGNKAEIGNTLEDGARIGIRMEEPADFTEGYAEIMGSALPKQFFVSDDVSYNVILSSEGEAALGIDSSYLSKYMAENSLSAADLKDKITVLFVDHRGGYSEDNVSITDTMPDQEYTGKPIVISTDYRKIEMLVYYGMNQLTENVDYKVSYANNTKAADSTAKKAPAVKITGMGTCWTGTRTIKFTIRKADIYPDMSGARFVITTGNISSYLLEPRLEPTIFTSASAKKNPSVKLKAWLLTDALTGQVTALKEGTDYELRYYPVIEGTVSTSWQKTMDKGVTRDYVVAINPLAKSKKITGSLDGADEEVLVNLLNRYQMPKIHVYSTDDGLDLSKAKIVGKLNTKALKFNDETEALEAIKEQFKNGTVRVMIGSQELTLDDEESGDFELDLNYPNSDNLRAGKNILTLSGTGYKDEDTSEGHQRVFGRKDITFTMKPDIKLTAKTVSVENMVKALSLDNYNRLYGAQWQYIDEDILKVNKDGDIQLKVKKSGAVLGPEWYEMSISRYEAGVSTLKVTFRGDPEYGVSGSFTVKVPVRVPALKDLEASGNLKVTVAETAMYSQAGAKPEVTVQYKDAEGMTRILKEGVDYKLSYKNNKALSTEIKKASVTIKGMGWFKGSLAPVTYDVLPARLGKEYAFTYATVDAAFNPKGKNGYFMTKPVLIDAGKALKAGKQYKIIESKYVYAENATDINGTVHMKNDPVMPEDRPEAGTKIEGSWTIQFLDPKYRDEFGSDTVVLDNNTYRIMPKTMNIASAKVKVNGGKPVTLSSDGSAAYPEIELTLNKQPVDPNDYQIISIEKNWWPGTAKMVIRGRNNCWGTKTITFKITKNSFKN